jgi:Na+(H+)/acetate symporter ActP
VLPSLRIDVAQNPAFSTVTANRAIGGWSKVSWQYILLAISGLILAIFIGWRVTGILSRWMHHRRQQREAGEAWAFRRAIEACYSGTATDAYQAITIWLTRCDQVRNGLTLHQLAKASGDPELRQEVESLQRAVASGSDQDWNGQSLAQLLRKYRSSSDRQSSRRLKLAPLNPE